MTGYLTPPLKLFYPHERLFVNSIYCTFCRNLSKRRLLLNRLFLNYDSIFFYLLFVLANPSYRFYFSSFRCSYNFSDRFYIVDNGLLEYFTDYSTLFNNLKFFDNYLDENKILSKLYLFLYKNFTKTLKYIPENVWEDFNFKFSKKILKKSIKTNEIELDIDKIEFFIEQILPLDYINYQFRSNISIIISNLIKLLYYLDAIDDFSKDIKSNKKNILFQFSDNCYSKSYKLKNDYKLLEKIKAECFFSLNFALNEIEKLPNDDYKHIVKLYFTDLIPYLLDKALIKNGAKKIFSNYF